VSGREIREKEILENVLAEMLEKTREQGLDDDVVDNIRHYWK
jgi:CRISPR/Cas system CSM-associated protein Csm2 small subunit